MDTQQSFDADFSFAFKRRSHSPAPYECLAPASLHNPSVSDSQSPPPSLSDATSQASHGSPRDWNAFPWMHPSSYPSNTLPSDQPWSWGHLLTSPIVPKTESSFAAHSIDPAVLGFEDSFLAANHPLLSNQSFPADLFGLPTFAQLRPVPTPIPTLSLQTPAQETPTVPYGLNSVESRDHDLIMGAIQAAGVQAAALPSTPLDIVSGTSKWPPNIPLFALAHRRFASA